MLKLVGVARSTYYYWKSLREKREDSKGKRRGKRPPGYCLSETGERIKDEDVVLRIVADGRMQLLWVQEDNRLS